MSLDWSAKDIAGWDEWTDTKDADGNQVNWIKFQSIVFGCMVTGIGTLRNEQDCRDWWQRYAVWCKLNDYTPGFTFDDVKFCIGLRTNVFPRLTDLQWAKRHVVEKLSSNRDLYTFKDGE